MSQLHQQLIGGVIHVKRQNIVRIRRQEFNDFTAIFAHAVQRLLIAIFCLQQKIIFSGKAFLCDKCPFQQLCYCAIVNAV